jgi:hypothetical protein
MFGLGTISQEWPLQCSVNVCATVPIKLVIERAPTAQTSFLEMTATDSRSFVPALGLGVVVGTHVEPFQCIANVVEWQIPSIEHD